ncbi:MAG: cytochrome c [Croceibacterium sp.]
MKLLHKIALAGATILLIPGCETVPPAAKAPSDAGMVDVRQAMIDGVNPAALAIWDVGNGVLDDGGSPDLAKLDPVALSRLREAAQMLDTYAELMAEAPVLKASGPDLVGGRLPEGVASREQIQAAIDSNPAGFRAYSRAMGAEAEAILAAIQSGDRAEVANRVASFDGACQSCHERYWYVN